ncbi:MAG: DUF4252 domain-containing protein [Verrucomicrobiae bacterium]|nr:DUF4252 domain-containing protein [Verrucomicrobiae bacterium]
MNSLLRTTAALAASLTLLLPLTADTPGAGYVDLGHFSRSPEGGQFVEVNINGSLLAMAVKIAESEEPEVAELLRGLHAVRVNVLGVNDSNRQELTDRVESLRSTLSTGGWERVVTVQEKDQDVGVFLKTDGADAIQGVVLTVLNGKDQAVFVNIVGNIQPEKIAQVGEHFGIEPLQKLGKAVDKKKK